MGSEEMGAERRLRARRRRGVKQALHRGCRLRGSAAVVAAKARVVRRLWRGACFEFGKRHDKAGGQPLRGLRGGVMRKNEINTSISILIL